MSACHRVRPQVWASKKIFRLETHSLGFIIDNFKIKGHSTHFQQNNGWLRLHAAQHAILGATYVVLCSKFCSFCMFWLKKKSVINPPSIYLLYPLLPALRVSAGLFSSLSIFFLHFTMRLAHMLEQYWHWVEFIPLIKLEIKTKQSARLYYQL